MKKTHQIKLIFIFLLTFLSFLYISYSNINSTFVGNDLFSSEKLDLDESFFRQNINYVFIDLGSNRGDSIYSFFGHEKNNLPGIINPKLVNIANWTIYAFEPNPVFDKDLLKMKDILSKQHKVILHQQTAGWTYDGYVEFYIDAVNKDGVGSSLLKTHRDVKNGKLRLSIKCLDIAKILREYKKEDFIFLKVDIEGAEYKLFTHLITNKVLDLIDNMAIEYHPYIKLFQSPEHVFNSIFRASGISLFEWI